MSDGALRIGIIGDFNRHKHSHWATEAALFHAAAQLGRHVAPRWFGTRQLALEGPGPLTELDGIWGAPGSPWESVDGKLIGIRFARERGVPYLGTCAGFQYALIELTRNLLGIPDADSAENGAATENIVITPISCPVPKPGSPTLCGELAVLPIAGTRLEALCGARELRGEFFCNLEANEAYLERWQAAGLRVCARDEAGALRAFELPAHPFFLASLFQPQLSSRFDRPHPIVVGFLRACARGE
jgi:CTP synthase (UTP-ammonia lyase)